jgi:hypothetical protein
MTTINTCSSATSPYPTTTCITANTSFPFVTPSFPFLHYPGYIPACCCTLFIN